MAEKAKNYTDEMVAEMHDLYTANPTRETVEVIAEQFGKSVRSVIAKLSREGIYVSQPRVTKTGEPVVRKAELVAQIEAHFEIEIPTLVKASKSASIVHVYLLRLKNAVLKCSNLCTITKLLTFHMGEKPLPLP